MLPKREKLTLNVSNAVCLISRDNVAAFNGYTIKTQKLNMLTMTIFPTMTKKRRKLKLCSKLSCQAECFLQTIHELAAKVSYMLSYKSSSDGEVFKDCRGS